MSISRGIIPAAAVAVAAVALLAACAGTSVTASRSSVQSGSGYLPQTQALGPQALQTPALLTVSSNSHALEYWPIKPGGGKMPTKIAPFVAHAGQMAANGDEIAIVNAVPSRIVLYRLKTNQKRSITDSFGAAYDIAIRKDGALYVENLSNKAATIAMYPRGSSHGQIVPCTLLGFSGYIAADDEGDIFFNGLLSNNQQGVIEIPNPTNTPSPNGCRALNLNAETGYISGVAIDPKTDALLTLSAPDYCAGGYEAELTIYPKPYDPKTATVHELNGNCSGGLRLNADSTILFYGDQDVSGSYSFIRQATYPGGVNFGTYSGGGPSGFTTVPNTLPN